MGAKQSAPPPPPPPPPLFSEPWRKVNWGENEDVLKFVKDYQPPTEGQQIRILLHGPVGAGMSSFINSVQSVLRGRIYLQALSAGASCDSFTRKFTTYKIPKEDQKSFYPFVFNDLMGLEPNTGVLVDDVKLVLRGHIKDGYTFNPDSKMSEDDPFYNKSPDINNKVHVLVCVIDARTVSGMRDDVLKKIRDIRMDATELEIPQMVIFTKIDEACDDIKEDLKNVYKVRSLKEKMEQFSANVGFPVNCIFPVKNYHEETDVNEDVDSLILSALRHIINSGDDYINLKKSSEKLINFKTL